MPRSASATTPEAAQPLGVEGLGRSARQALEVGAGVAAVLGRVGGGEHVHLVAVLTQQAGRPRGRRRRCCPCRSRCGRGRGPRPPPSRGRGRRPARSIRSSERRRPGRRWPTRRRRASRPPRRAGRASLCPSPQHRDGACHRRVGVRERERSPPPLRTRRPAPSAAPLSLTSGAAPVATTSTSRKLQAVSPSALATASLAQKRAARCMTGRALGGGVLALGVREEPLGEPRPPLRAPARAAPPRGGRCPRRSSAARRYYALAIASPRTTATREARARWRHGGLSSFVRTGGGNRQAPRAERPRYSTVTVLARLRGWSTSGPRDGHVVRQELQRHDRQHRLGHPSVRGIETTSSAYLATCRALGHHRDHVSAARPHLGHVRQRSCRAPASRWPRTPPASARRAARSARASSRRPRRRRSGCRRSP